MLTLPLEAIDKQEALRYMGCPAEPDETLRTVVDTCEQQLRRTVQPRVVYRVLPLCREAGTLSAGGMQLTGEDIARHLAECDRMLLMAATLSGQADQLIHRAGISDMTRSLAMDALASAGIEQVCNRAEECFREQLPDTYFTWRFSPGYGDLPLSLQPEILRLLDAEKRLGLTVTAEHILIPRKSVTAIIGLAEKGQEAVPPAACGKPVCSERAARTVKEALHKARLTALYAICLRYCLKNHFQHGHRHLCPYCAI